MKNLTVFIVLDHIFRHYVTFVDSSKTLAHDLTISAPIIFNSLDGSADDDDGTIKSRKGYGIPSFLIDTSVFRGLVCSDFIEK
jgi:hypothetical protein